MEDRIRELKNLSHPLTITHVGFKGYNVDFDQQQISIVCTLCLGMEEESPLPMVSHTVVIRGEEYQKIATAKSQVQAILTWLEKADFYQILSTARKQAAAAPSPQ